jgi:hypothetical protein
MSALPAALGYVICRGWMIFQVRPEPSSRTAQIS